jgi:ketosteroid isomerase-like protein
MEIMDGDEKLLKKANEAFYRAFESLDIERMEQVWDTGTEVQCIHPGWDLLQGWTAVRESWEGIFKNTRYMEFRINYSAVHHVEDLGYIICVENITSSYGGPASETSILATNIFRKRNGVWKMIHHHGSPLIG